MSDKRKDTSAEKEFDTWWNELSGSTLFTEIEKRCARLGFMRGFKTSKILANGNN